MPCAAHSSVHALQPALQQAPHARMQGMQAARTKLPCERLQDRCDLTPSPSAFYCSHMQQCLHLESDSLPLREHRVTPWLASTYHGLQSDFRTCLLLR